jgi:hypothetical protein
MMPMDGFFGDDPFKDDIFKESPFDDGVDPATGIETISSADPVR